MPSPEDRPSPELLGRDRELAMLDPLLERAGNGAPCVAVMSGEPGIGKSRLLAELRERADARGMLALYGQAAELERDLPFAALVDACDGYLAGFEMRQRLEADVAAELARIFPALGPPSPQASVALVDERYRAHRAVSELLELVAAGRGVALLLDDVHWADPATLELLGHLVRRPPKAGVLLVLAHRTGQMPSRLRDAVARRADAVEAMHLLPLDRANADRLVGDLDAASRDLVYREGGGNPFYLHELARSVRAGRAATLRLAGDEQPDRVPAAVRAAIGDELDALGESARALAFGGAVTGDPFELDLAAEIGDLARCDALRALDELVARELVRATEAPRRFAFRHPLVRRAIYESCPPGERLAAHGRAAAALAARGASPAVRAHHVTASASFGDERAISLLRAAAGEVGPRAPDTAAVWLEAALALMPESECPQHDCGALTAELGRALVAAGRTADSLAVLLRAVQRLPADEHEARVDLSVQAATVELLLGRTQSARCRLEAIAELAPRASLERLAIDLRLTITAYRAADFERMSAAAAAAADCAAHMDDRLADAVAAAIGAAAAAYGELERAEAECDRAAAALAELSDARLASAVDALLTAGAAALCLGRYAESAEQLERGIAVARTSRNGQFVVLLMAMLAGAELGRGRLAVAAKLARDADEAAQLTGGPLVRAWALNWRTRVALAKGDLADALAAGEEGLEVARTIEGPAMTRWLATALGAALLDAGDAERARRLLLEGLAGPGPSGLGAVYRTAACERLCACALALGRPDEAEEWATRAGDIAVEIRLPVALCHARLARTAVLLAAGANVAAAEAALGAADAAAGQGAVVEIGRARLLAGRALAADQRRKHALTELDAASELLSDCGAERLRQEAAAELRRLGRRYAAYGRRGRSDASGLDALSQRELEVAQLVAELHTNAEIARELFLSPKTVESHLRNIFHKLGVAKRAELGRVVDRFAARGALP